MNIKKLAIVIAPNWRDYAEKYLEDCLASVRTQDWSGEYKIFLFDNESTPETVDFIKKVGPEIELGINKNNDGFCKGNNDAIKAALDQGFEYIVLLNMDTQVTPNWLSELVAAAQRSENWGAVQSRLMLHPEKDKVNSLGNKLHFLGFGFSAGDGVNWSELERQTVDLAPITYFSGASVILRKDVLDKVGLFDEKFWMYHDDLELSLRIRLAGYNIYLAKDSVVYHKYKFAKSIKQYYWMERNRFISLLILYRLPTLLLILPMLMVMEFGLLLYAIKNGFVKEKLRVYAWLINPMHWDYLTERRRRIKKIRCLKDRDLAPLLASKIEFQQVDNLLLRYIGNPLMTVYWKIVKIIIIW